MYTTYKIKVTEETANLLERLSFEVMTKEGVVARIITTGATPEVFNGLPYQTFMKQLEEANIAYDAAKKQLERSLMDEVAKKGHILQSWRFDDFKSKEVEVTVATDMKPSTCKCGNDCPDTDK